MIGNIHECTLDVSEHFFRLATESLRLRSNETSRFQTLASFIASRVAEARKIADHDAATLREHLTAVPTNGSIRINFDISDDSATLLAGTQERLNSILDADISFGDTLSILLFDYIVDQKTMQILSTLGLDEPTDKRGELIANDPQ